MTNAETPRPQAESAPGPGRLLREARERMNLGQHAVADALHLRLAVVDALEHDRYDQLPPATFTKGYLKVYAKLVHVEEGEVLAAYQREVGEAEKAADAAPSRRSTMRPEGRRAWLVAVPLVVLAVIVVWGAWEHWAGTDDAVSSPPAAEGPAPREEAAPEPDTAENAVRDVLAESEVPASVPRVDEPEPSLAAVATPEPAVEPTAEPPAAQPAAPAGLALHLAADSWIEVRDADGNNVLVGTLSGPETYEVSAPAPYHLVIGHAAAVEVVFDGESVDLTPHTRGRVARFTLGTE